MRSRSDKDINSAEDRKRKKNLFYTQRPKTAPFPAGRDPARKNSFVRDESAEEGDRPDKERQDFFGHLDMPLLSLSSDRRRTPGFNPEGLHCFGYPARVRAGFTMIELMLVVIIIGCLAAMVMPRLTGRSDQARLSVVTAEVTANIPTALKLYELDNGFFPTTSDGLVALLQKTSSAANWRGPYLDRKPIDPWGREYKYVSPGIHRPNDYDLYSLGKDGVEGNDDVTNWE